MPDNVTQEMAKQAYEYAFVKNKNDKSKYDSLPEVAKKAAWQYGYDRKLVDVNKLGAGAKAEYQKYVDPNKPEYAMQASIVLKTPKQYYQTQNEKMVDAITPFGIKNMVNQTPEQIAAKPIVTSTLPKTIDRRLLNERRLGEYTTQEQKAPIRTNSLDRSQEQYSEGKTFKKSDAILAGLASAATLGAPNKAIQQELKPGQGGYYLAGNIAGSITPGAGIANAAGKGLAKLGAGKLLQNLGGGAVAGAAIDTTQGIVEGDSGTDLAKRIGRGAVIGLGADLGLTGLSKVIGTAINGLKAGQLSKISVLETPKLTPTTNIKSQGAYKVKNTRLDKAIEEYNNAIETIQNHFKTNELRADEMARIKPELGIDLDNIVKNMEDAQKGISVSDIGKRRNLSNAAGVTDLPKIKDVKNKQLNIKKPMSFEQFKSKAKWDSYDGDYGVNVEDIRYPTLGDGPEQMKRAYNDYLRKFEEINAVKSSTIKQNTLGNINPLPQQKTQPQAAINALGNTKLNAARTAKEAVEKATDKKDISGFQAYTTDVYRNFEKVFGDDYGAVKKEILDPFDNAKKAKAVEDRQLMTELKKNIVDKFNIQKGSKDSALVQQYGEKRLSYESLVDQAGKAKADKIVEADKWFRQQYDRLIDEVNAARQIVYPNNPEKLIPRRNDYYRHFKELSDNFAGLKNIFETPSQISPSLAGMSEFTKPKSKFLSFAQKRGNGKFTDDAVGGFLDYINAATYAKHIDTQIPKFRGLAADLATATEQTKNMNNFIGYLTDFANDLAGKTNPADRFAQKIIPGGRTTFKALNWLNSRVKANTVLGNLSSSLSQVANLPQGIAYVKNPEQLAKGAGNFVASIFGKGDAKLYNQSGFILERYADNAARQFDTKLLDQPKKFAAWMLGAVDELGTKTIWSSVYQKALADKVSNPIKYADDVTRKLVAGRGIGEVPLIQKSKIMQLIAPFTVEVNNLWKVQKDFIKAKDFGGLAMLYLANFALNKGMEQVRGDGVVFDPIQAIYDAATEEDLSAAERAGRLGGEVLSNVPLGSTLATLYPEQGISNEFVDLPTREKLFGRNDPTRFGSGLLVAKGIQDPLYKILPPFAGGQAKKTIQAGQDLGLLPKLKKEKGKLLPKLEKQDMPASYSNTRQGDRLRTTIDPIPSTIARGLAFGRGAIPEVKKYYDSGKVPLGVMQTEKFKKLVDRGYDQNKLFETLNGIRGTNKKVDIVAKLRQQGYNEKQIAEIWEVFYK